MKSEVTLGEGGVPGRPRLSVACVTMRVRAGRAWINESVWAFVSRDAVRKVVLICSKNEMRFVVGVNRRINGRASSSLPFSSTRSFVSAKRRAYGPITDKLFS